MEIVNVYRQLIDSTYPALQQKVQKSVQNLAQSRSALTIMKEEQE